MTTATQRVEDLLVQHATEGLAPELERELARLLPDSGATDRETFLLAAAAVELAYTDDDEPLPSLSEPASEPPRALEPQPAPEPEPQPAPAPEPHPAPEPDPQPAPEPEPQPAPEPEPQPEPEPAPAEDEAPADEAAAEEENKDA